MRSISDDTLFAFTRALVDVDSTTGQEGAAAALTASFLRQHGDGHQGGWDEVSLWPVAPGRDNVFARRGQPRVVLSTHLDTVPPFFPSREDDERIYGRGACDAKGICAAMCCAALELAAEGVSDFGLLFVVGEERNSAGAIAANALAPALAGPRYLINGEPTESRLMEAGKGVLRVALRAHGRAAHSAYPELGDSAIHKLLPVLARLQAMPLPHDRVLGPTTLNIGTIAGGRAPNVIADEAEAELMFRLVGPGAPVRAAVEAAVAGEVEHEFVLEIPPVRLATLPGYPTGIVAFGTDIPQLGNWGTPLLFGPGSIQVAHTAGEFIEKRELAASVGAYTGLARALLCGENPQIFA
ncbi:MAG: M20/M25/M40 family metallo-hydrolase [Terriglobales bacterium]